MTTTMAIAGIPEQRVEQLGCPFAAQPHLQSVRLFGLRAMGRHQQGSEIDLCLEGPQLSHGDRLRVMVAVADRSLPWQVNLALRHELPADLVADVQRVGHCNRRRP